MDMENAIWALAVFALPIVIVGIGSLFFEIDIED